MATVNFGGHRNKAMHRSTGSRAWCSGCGEWCYPSLEMSCACCIRTMADEKPCPHCDGTGIAPDPPRPPRPGDVTVGELIARGIPPCD